MGFPSYRRELNPSASGAKRVSRGIKFPPEPTCFVAVLFF